MHGPHAGWLAYGVAIAGEASLVISVEDITGKYETSEETVNAKTGRKEIRRVMDLHEVVKRIVATMRVREEAEGKEFGVIVIAEGLAEFLPYEHIEGVPRDEHGHIAIAKISLSRLFADLVAQEYTRQTGKKRKITGLQIGYESRCARPQAFDVMLGSQLGVGAYRALVEKRLDGVMVSVSGQLELNYVPVQPVGRSGHAGHGGPLHRARLRLPPPGAVPGNVRQRLRAERLGGHISRARERRFPPRSTACPQAVHRSRTGSRRCRTDSTRDLSSRASRSTMMPA